ncbi:phage portal protein [Allokutzneria sp. A3M-2-11 16]|uniref:phage portal protein n=1 Tax=Allokutzneria sp. A3M-2-11 16 TaxID=2962043 RepID=UPI0020B85CE8|nr:phage portal protein [Allokutzneria sp. A3M-2-11 16]MCP3799755.1 phage portal protein [Allokutzneria sp. A3M-2-11 16]
MGDLWPPAPFNRAAQRMREWDAWYVGKPEQLAAFYANGPVVHTRPSQYRGGLVGAVSRFFWGRPTSPRGQQRTRLHVPLASDIATASADLLFAEPPRITVENSSAQTRLDQIVNTPAVHSALLEAAEVAAALGGVYLRVVWDADVTRHAMLDTVDADAAVPEWRWKQLAAVTFWHTVEHSDGASVLRHLERHEPGRIVHSLYQGTDDELGRPIPLTEHPSTAWAAELVDAEGAIETGTRRLTAGYVPNIRPSREWRSVTALKPLGRSDFDGVEPLLDALDETYSSWMRDVRLAKARLLVPAGYLQPLGPGQGAVFDDDQEVFTELNMLTGRGDGSPPITPSQFAIRVREHRETVEQITLDVLRAAGYSPSTFGEVNGATGVTATEVTDRREMSETTRDKKSRYWQATLGPLTGALLDVDRHVFGGTMLGLDETPVVDFGDQAQPDPAELARTAQTLLAAEAASTDVRVRMVHPEWDDDQVDAEVARILAETGRAVPDPATFRGFDQGGGERDAVGATTGQ